MKIFSYLVIGVIANEKYKQATKECIKGFKELTSSKDLDAIKLIKCQDYENKKV